MRARNRKDGIRGAATETVAAPTEYPSILREYASSGFRDDARVRVPPDLRPSSAYGRHATHRDRAHQENVETENAPERYGDGGPYWQRKG